MQETMARENVHAPRAAHQIPKKNGFLLAHENNCKASIGFKRQRPWAWLVYEFGAYRVRCDSASKPECSGEKFSPRILERRAFQTQPHHRPWLRKFACLVPTIPSPPAAGNLTGSASLWWLQLTAAGVPPVVLVSLLLMI